MELWGVKTATDNGRVVFCYWASCVTGKADTLWNATVNEHAKEEFDKTYDGWMTCVGFYLEKMQNMAYIGDAVCDKILRWKRPVTVSFINHVDRIYELVNYITQGYLRCGTYSPLHTA